MSKKVLVIISLSIILLCILRSNFIGISKSQKTQATTIGFPTNMPSIYIEPSNISTSPGETFDVSVRIFNLTNSFWQTEIQWFRGDDLGPWSDFPLQNYSLGNLLGLDIQLGWDETVLKFVSNVTKIPVEDHPDGVLHAPIFKIRDEVNETHGFPWPQPEESRYWLACTTLGGPYGGEPSNGNGTVLKLTFEVLKEGASNLTLTMTRLADADGTPIPHRFFSAFFRSPVCRPIYIRADGSIDPTTANITSFDNVTYTFIGNINESIVVERNNIVVDGDGYTLQGSGSGNGFNCSSTNNVTIQNTNIKNFINGIWLDSSSSNSISGNHITANSGYGIKFSSSSNYNNILGNHIAANNEYGIRLGSSSNCSISGNSITTNSGYGIGLGIYSNYNSIQGNNIAANSDWGIGLSSSSNYNSIQGNHIENNWDGIKFSSSSNCSISGNNITNNGYGIWLDSSSNNSILGNNIAANSDWGIIFYSSSDCSVSGNHITNSDWGIVLHLSSNNSISGNHITANSGYGIRFSSSSNCSVSGNNITNNDYGIYLSSSSSNSISGNSITANNAVGILLGVYSSYNSISGNNIENNFAGVYLQSSFNNTFSGNNITNNDYGIYLSSSPSNRVFHNNLINNTNQVYSINSVNIWDYGYPSGGNYWSNYTGVDLNHDGIGDTPHVIDANNTDHYPLMGMFHSFNTSLGKSINVISNSSVSGFMYESPGTIRFHVSNKTVNQTYGFCRVSVPYEVMMEPFNVTIDGANPTYANYTLYDNGTHRWIYFEYEHSNLEIVIVPEFPSFLILPLFMTATLLAAMVYRRKHS